MTITWNQIYKSTGSPISFKDWITQQKGEYVKSGSGLLFDNWLQSRYLSATGVEPEEMREGGELPLTTDGRRGIYILLGIAALTIFLVFKTKGK